MSEQIGTKKVILCPNCEGSGLTEKGQCSDCSGTGKLEAIVVRNGD